jgi:hypothetical protein
MVPREIGRYMTASTGLHSGRVSWSSHVAEGERKSHGKTGSKVGLRFLYRSDSSRLHSARRE